MAAEVKSHQHPQVEEVFDDESAEHWSGATLNSLFVEVVAPRINPQAHADNAPALEPQVASSAVVEAAQRHDRPPDGTVRQAWPESYASVKIGPLEAFALKLRGKTQNDAVRKQLQAVQKQLLKLKDEQQRGARSAKKSRRATLTVRFQTDGSFRTESPTGREAARRVRPSSPSSFARATSGSDTDATSEWTSDACLVDSSGSDVESPPRLTRQKLKPQSSAGLAAIYEASAKRKGFTIDAEDAAHPEPGVSCAYIPSPSPLAGGKRKEIEQQPEATHNSAAAARFSLDSSTRPAATANASPLGTRQSKIDVSATERLQRCGRVICCKADGRDAPLKVPMVRMLPNTIWGNPFDLEGKESNRTRAYAAFHAWWGSPGVKVDAICDKYHVNRCKSWKGDEVAASEARIQGVQTLRRIVAKGNGIALGCKCPPGKACHTWAYRAMILRGQQDAVALEDATSDSLPDNQMPDVHLIVYSGTRKVTRHLAQCLEELDVGSEVVTIDILDDPIHQDVRDPQVLLGLVQLLLSGRVVSCFLAIPCSSYSVVRGEQLRSNAEPRGMAEKMAQWAKYIEKHNELTDVGCFLAELCDQLNILWMIENPAKRNDPKSSAYWAEFADWASLWDVPRVHNLEQGGAKRIMLAMCAFNRPYQKLTELLTCEELAVVAQRVLANYQCTHHSHADQIVGVDERGKPKAALAGQYSPEFNAVIASIIVEVLQGQREARQPKEVSPVAPKRRRSEKPQSTSVVGMMHVGSAKPHDPNGRDEQWQRHERWAKPGSLRNLEPELKEALFVEPLPETNVPKVAGPDPDPVDKILPPPMTTDELIPSGIVRQTQSFIDTVASILQRSARSKEGWKAARSNRPEPLALSEEEALNPAARGFPWKRREPHKPLRMDSLWDPVQVSSWPDNPPNPKATQAIDTAAFVELAEKYGLTDERVTSWVKHGFPGVEMPNATVLAPPHVGALKEAAAYEERNQRDVDAGFCTEPRRFPERWPVVTTPCNIVVQNGKPRLTIDPTMWISGRVDIPPANALIDLVAEAVRAGRLKLITIAQVSRGAAILLAPLTPSCGVSLLITKWDVLAFFRNHKKKDEHVCQQGRITAKGINLDLMINFGERNAPDHTCGTSDSVSFFIKCELLRLDSEYPTQVPELQMWLERRREIKMSMGVADDKFTFDVLFYTFCYVDDMGLETYDENLVDRQGRKISFIDEKGITRRQTRMDLYRDAAIKMTERVYGPKSCPHDKRDVPAKSLVYIGGAVDLREERRYLPKDKALKYGQRLDYCLHGRRRMPNGVIVCEYAHFNSLLHRLLHASEMVPLGKAHLFYCRQALALAREVGISKHRKLYSVLITAQVVKEMRWWRHQLEHADEVGLPLACRHSFPGSSSESVLVRYSDASRETEDPTQFSGGGAWCVIDDVFYWLRMEWTEEELKYSINVLEAHARDIGGVVFLDLALKLGRKITHTMAFIDNSAAENIAESGKASTDMLHELNMRRLNDLQHRGVFETNERVASVDNDVADDISRGAFEEALRFPASCGMKTVECEIPADIRRLPSLGSK